MATVVVSLLVEVVFVLLAHYQNEVNAYSKGQGRFSFQPDGYDVCQDTDEIVTQIGYDPEMDIRNPSSSIFCAMVVALQ